MEPKYPNILAAIEALKDSLDEIFQAESVDDEILNATSHLDFALSGFLDDVIWVE